MTRAEADNAHWIRTCSDEELARRAQSGSRPCFAEIVARFEARLYSFLRRRTPRAADAEDLTQDTFLRAWQHLGRYDPSRRFSTWLFTIAARLAINHHRQHRRQRTALDPQVEQAPAEPPDDPADLLARRELGAHAWDLAAQVLTDDQHAVLWLRYAEALPVGDIARVMSRSALSVRVQLFRARQALARHLAAAPTSPAPSLSPSRRAASVLRPAPRQPVAGGIR